MKKPSGEQKNVYILYQKLLYKNCSIAERNRRPNAQLMQKTARFFHRFWLKNAILSTRATKKQEDAPFWGANATWHF